MIEKSTMQRVLEAFFEYPSKEFHLRELSRMLRLSMPTIIAATDAISKLGLVAKTKGKVVTKVTANRESADFTRRKRLYNLEKIYSSGLVEYLSKAYNYPKCIILFGSFSRGEDTESSDIDMAVVTGKRLSPDLKNYEAFLGRSVSIHEVEMAKISPEFKASLANGIVVEGSW